MHVSPSWLGCSTIHTSDTRGVGGLPPPPRELADPPTHPQTQPVFFCHHLLAAGLISLAVWGNPCTAHALLLDYIAPPKSPRHTLSKRPQS